MAPRKKPKCTCPPDLQKICKSKKKPDKMDVEDVMNSLIWEAQLKKQARKCKAPKLTLRKFKRPVMPTCPPMNPDMHTRLRFISHCNPEPYKRVFPDKRAKMICTPEICDLDFASSEGESKKGVRYKDQQPLMISVPKPFSCIQHTDSDTSIFNVPSPKMSGEKIAVRRASVKPMEVRPPMPGKSAHDLFKPHSGIVINQDKTFVPDETVIPGPYRSYEPRIKQKRRRRPCHKGGICSNKNCKRKRCRIEPCKAISSAKESARGRKRKRSRTCLSDSARSAGAMGSKPRGRMSKSGRRPPARDGKPRTRYSRSRRGGDDDTCGLDDHERPEYPELPMGLKRGSIKTHSLTTMACTRDRRPDVHYGILMGTFNMYNEKFSGRSKGKQALAMSVMAYCLAFHYHPKQWTMKLIDNLLDAGDVWYNQCADKVHDHSAYQGMCEVLPFGKKQILVLNGKRMQVLLCEPDIVGYTMSKDPMVYNLCRGLKAFFMDNRAGVLLTRILKLVIWKDKICFYIFDPAGRNSKAYSNFVDGTGALINVKDEEAVAEILLARSILDDQRYVLAAVKLLKMVSDKADDDLESERELTQAEKALMSYRILSENCAIVNANMHLGDRCFQETKFRQALPIAVAALTYAKISPPNTWFTKTLDKILKLGNKLFIDCSHPDVLTDLTIDNIPNQITIGPYVSEIIIYRERVKGQLFTTKECLLNITTGLAEFFKQYNSGILEFNNYTLAIWKQKDMFYLFDPYPRSNDGERCLKIGKACCLMLLDTESIAEAFTRNWSSLPVTTQFQIHAYKVLKLKKKEPKIGFQRQIEINGKTHKTVIEVANQIKCTLSDSELPGARFKKRAVLGSSGYGDGKDVVQTGEGGGGKGGLVDVLPVEMLKDRTKPVVDEELMGDIISLVDSIQDDFIPPIPIKFKNMPPEELPPKVFNLDSPTVSVTQIIPPWPKPRDKTNEPVEPDPDPEPTPPPTPPPMPPPEGGVEEEEMGEEELDEEALKEKKEAEKRKKAEEEEARRKAEELPPALPPPPPSPQGEADEVPLATATRGGGGGQIGGLIDAIEMETVEPVSVERYILLTEDAKRRFKLRQIHRKMTAPLTEKQEQLRAADADLTMEHNFKDLPDTTQMIRGSKCIADSDAANILPFAAIMAIVTSYKYSIETWTKGIVDFVLETANKLYSNKREKFQLSPIHIIPKIGIGHQAYHATIDVVGEGPTWRLEDVLCRKFFPKHDRGIITTSHYSCAFFKRNGLYYLFDGSNCNPMGLRDANEKSGKACFLRFRNIHDLACRIVNNKDGLMEDQQFILSRILVRRLLPEARQKLTEDHDFETGLPKDRKKSKQALDQPKGKKMTALEETPILDDSNRFGYKEINGAFRISGTTSLSGRKSNRDVKSCHFVCLMAMLMATIHPLRKWDNIMVDTCIEKGLEIYEKALNLSPCEKRVIKNIIVDGKFMNINIKKIIVVNENQTKTMEQYMRAVLHRLRYVIVRYPQCSLVVCQADGFYHIFDPYGAPREGPEPIPGPKQPKKKMELRKEDEREMNAAGWTLYRYIDSLLSRIRTTIDHSAVNSPEFYTFELTSVKSAPRFTALNYKLSPLFKPEENPNAPYITRRRKCPRPLVDEKMYWLEIASVPWSRMNMANDLGFDRGTPRTMWKDWDIEIPEDLYSLWGTVHPMDLRFDEKARGKQYLACCIVALAMTKACDFNSWTGSFLDGIVIEGDKYHTEIEKKIGGKQNAEINIEDFQGSSYTMYPYQIQVKAENIIFGFVYNINQDRFNLSKAMSLFFENNTIGMLTSTARNLAFGKIGSSYFMFDCQSFGAPVFCPNQGAAYILKCESLNRLIYCIAITMNVRRHNQLFHLYTVDIKLTEAKGK